jgi:hypothetical protein
MSTLCRKIKLRQKEEKDVTARVCTLVHVNVLAVGKVARRVDVSSGYCTFPRLPISRDNLRDKNQLFTGRNKLGCCNVLIYMYTSNGKDEFVPSLRHQWNQQHGLASQERGFFVADHRWMVRLAGIEPTTLGFGGQYSIH